MDAAQPAPGEGLARPAEPVGTGVSRQVGLVHGDRGQAELPGYRGAVRAQENRAGQVHDLGPVLDKRVTNPVAGQAQPEAWVTGQRDRGHADDGVGERAGLACPARRVGRNDKRVVTVAGEEFGDA